MSLHDLRVASRLDLIVVMHDGRLRAVGRPEEVLTAELLADVFACARGWRPALPSIFHETRLQTPHRDRQRAEAAHRAAMQEKQRAMREPGGRREGQAC